MGVAVLDGSELLYYGIKIMRNTGAVEEVGDAASRIIRQLIEAYSPNALALTRTLVIQSSGERLVSVIHEVKQSAERKGIPIREYAPKTVRQFICGSKKATKQQAVRVLAARHPELAQYAQGRGEWEELYYAKMFGAVGVGLTDYYSRAIGIPPQRSLCH